MDDRQKKQILWALTAIGSLVLIGLASMALDAWLPKLVDALQATTTLFLVLVTGVYAYLTYRSVSLQENPPYVRLLSHEKATTELSALLMKRGQLSSAFSGSFPLHPEVGKPLDEEFFKKMEDFAKLADDVMPFSMQLPGETFALAMVAVDAVLRVAGCFTVLQTCQLKEEVAAMKGGREFSWGNVRDFYDADYRSQQPDYFPEWRELLDGEAARTAEDALNDLRSALGRYLMPNWNQPISAPDTPAAKAAFERWTKRRDRERDLTT